MPFSDGKYAKFGPLLQYPVNRTLIRITQTTTESGLVSHLMTATKLENLLKNHPGSSLEKIVQRAQQMDSLTTTLQASLPADLAENLVAANISDEDELVLVCRSSAWASRLRFESESMLEAARKAGESPTRCRVRVCR
jgi:hypothetical protein